MSISYVSRGLESQKKSTTTAAPWDMNITQMHFLFISIPGRDLCILTSIEQSPSAKHVPAIDLKDGSQPTDGEPSYFMGRANRTPSRSAPNSRAFSTNSG